MSLDRIIEGVIAIGAVAAIGGFAYYFYSKKNRKYKEIDLPEVKREAFTNESKTSPEEDFAKVAKKFSGNYEYIFQACEKQTNEKTWYVILRNWEVILKGLEGNAITCEWNKILSKVIGREWIEKDGKITADQAQNIAVNWTDNLRKWGVAEKDFGETFIIDDNSVLFYELTDMYEEGQKAIINKKCWIFTKTGYTLEKGVASPLS